MATPKELFVKIGERAKSQPDEAKKVNSIYQFILTGDGGGEWFADLTANPPNVAEGKNAGAKCTITMAAKDFVDMLEGRLNPQMAFMSGKLKVAGDMSLAMKLQAVLKM